MTGRDTPQEAHRFDVAISGASFAGLALACALSDAVGRTRTFAGMMNYMLYA